MVTGKCRVERTTVCRPLTGGRYCDGLTRREWWKGASAGATIPFTGKCALFEGRRSPRLLFNLTFSCGAAIEKCINLRCLCHPFIGHPSR